MKKIFWKLFKHAIWPPYMTYTIATITSIWALLEGMRSFTPWLNRISVYIFIGYLIVLLVAYLVCIMAYSYKLQQTIKELSDNNNGLINQHTLDSKDKKHLKDQLKLQQLITCILINEIPSDNLPAVESRLNIIKEVHNIDERNENSKDN